MLGMMMKEPQEKHDSISCDQWNGEDFGDQIFYNLHNSLSKYHNQIPELAGRRARGFFHGWVILSSNNMWSLWNPSTSRFIRLPPLHILKDGDSYDDIIRQCCLTSSPDDRGSILLLTRTDESAFVFCRLDGKTKRLRWTEMSYAKQLKRITGDGRLLHSLAYCNGKVYALNTDNCDLFEAVIIIDIAVKDKEVVIQLLAFGLAPYVHVDYHCEGFCQKLFLITGSSTMLYCVDVRFVEYAEKTIGAVIVFELNTATIECAEIDRLNSKEFDMTNVTELEDAREWALKGETWKEVSDLNDAIFFVDLARDQSVFYIPEIASQLGGYIHIRGKTGTIIYSYHVKDKTITRSYMPSPLLSLWEEKGLKGDCADCKQEEKDKDGEIMIRSVTEDEVESNESHLLNIPFHLLETVIKHCVGVEYMRFRATCKLCHSAAPLIRGRDKSRLTRLQNYSLVSPWLMEIDKEEKIITFTDPLLGDKYYCMYSLSPELILQKRIYCSRFGWLLFHYDSEDSPLVFYNPFTSDIRKLPPLRADSFSFSAPPTSKDCMVVGCLKGNDWGVYIHFVSGEFSWRGLNLNFAGDTIYSFRFPTFFGRDLYALLEDKLHIFKDLGVDDYSWEQDVAKPPQSCSTSWTKHFLTRHDLHLLLVMVSEASVEVFKLNESTKTWGKIDGLGRLMIYICDETCLCTEAKTPEMGNKIYLPELHSKNGRVVFYSLETCTYGTFNHKTVEETRTMVHYLDRAHTWIEPSWS